MTIEITEEEIKILDKMLSKAIWNGNHIDKLAFETSGEEYETVCQLFSKIYNEINI